MRPLDKLAVKQIDRRLNTLRNVAKQTRIRPGWIHYMREALGMTLKKLSERAGVAISTIAQAERSEAKGKVTLETLKKMANAMECELIYAFIPKDQIHNLLKQQALIKAKKLILEADTHMTLEDQQVKQSINSRINQLAEKLIEKRDVW